MKAVVLTKSTADALRQLDWIARCGPPESIRVVAPAREVEAIRASGRLAPGSIFAYRPAASPLLWLRLLLFLGFSRAIVGCTGSYGSPAIKLLALALRGRILLFNSEPEPAELTVGRFVRLTWLTFRRREGDVCLVGTAGRPRLEAILADIRIRLPHARVHLLAPRESLDLCADSAELLSARAIFSASRSNRRFARIVLPFTGGGFLRYKLLACFTPLGYREIYNENLDCYPARDFAAGLRHFIWRLPRHISFADLTRRMKRIPNRVAILGSASHERLAVITANARRRHPGAPCHGLLPASRAGSAHLFDEVTILSLSSAASWAGVLRALFGGLRAGWFVVPATREGHFLLKAVFWFLPLGRREIYNENYDFYSPRQVSLVARHFIWRVRSPFIGERIWRGLTARPPRITVLGSASGLYLKAVVADLRRRYPGMPIHGLLMPRSVRVAAPLFDSWTLFAPLSWEFWRVALALSAGRRRSGYLVMPWTNERSNLVKALGFFLPLGLRRVYNENADSYLCRDVRLIVRHALWRLRHRIFYQGLAEMRGRWLTMHVLHLAAYPFRLMAGALLLVFVRARVALSSVRPAPCESHAETLVIQREPRIGQ